MLVRRWTSPEADFGVTLQINLQIDPEAAKIALTADFPNISKHPKRNAGTTGAKLLWLSGAPPAMHAYSYPRAH